MTGHSSELHVIKRKKRVGIKAFQAVFLVFMMLGSLLAGFATDANAASWNPELTRYPYLTDVVNSYATVNFATLRSLTPDLDTAQVRYGKVGAESCTANAVPATRNNLTVAGVLEHQWKSILRVETGSEYCYRVYVYMGAAPEVDLLGADTAPVFKAQLPAGSNDPFSFIVFGDWGYVDEFGNNPIQAALMSTIANSGARFAVTVGDNVYPTEGDPAQPPGQTQYGDLNAIGMSTSAVFGSAFWKEPGKSIPLFPAIGNHGFSQAAIPTNHPHVLNFPQENAARLSGGRYTIDNYCCLNGTAAGNYASVWYAIDAGITRIYVLEAAWADSNPGSGGSYKNNYDYFFTPGTLHWEWLKADLAAHPTAVKLAVLHYPLYSDSTTEPSDLFLQGAAGLEGLLSQYNVQMTFSGHGHFYERNVEPNPNSVISYIVGGGGARLTPLDPNCETWDAFGMGWSYSSGGSSCGGATDPTMPEEVHHVVKVTVDGGSVNVQPINALGQVFDEITYDFTAGQEANAPSVPGTLTANPAGADQVLLNWNSSTDNTNVRGYTIYRNGVLWDYVTGGQTSYLDDRAFANGVYEYRVDAFDVWGNHSGLSNPAVPGGVPTGIKVYMPIIMR